MFSCHASLKCFCKLAVKCKRDQTEAETPRLLFHMRSLLFGTTKLKQILFWKQDLVLTFALTSRSGMCLDARKMRHQVVNYEVNMGFPRCKVTQLNRGRKQSEWLFSQVALLTTGAAIFTLYNHFSLCFRHEHLQMLPNNVKAQWWWGRSEGRLGAEETEQQKEKQGRKEGCLQPILDQLPGPVFWIFHAEVVNLLSVKLLSCSNKAALGTRNHFHTACCTWLAASQTSIFFLYRVHQSFIECIKRYKKAISQHRLSHRVTEPCVSDRD